MLFVFSKTFSCHLIQLYNCDTAGVDELLRLPWNKIDFFFQ